MDKQPIEPQIQGQVVRPFNKKWTKKIKIKAVILVIMALLVVAAGVLIYIGRLAVLIKEPYQKAALSVLVCGNDVVKQYNDIYNMQIEDEETYYKDQQNLLSNLNAKISAKAYYEQDPTCQMIIFQGAIFNDDVSTMNEAYDNIKDLYNNGLYASSEIYGSRPQSRMEQDIANMSSQINFEE
jgi:regulator of replication initiation timing